MSATEWLSVIAVLMLSVLLRHMTIENRDLTSRLNEARTICQQSIIAPPAPVDPVPEPVSDKDCMQWLFSTDLAHAKDRICGQK